jgi:hypothetical protein
MNPAYRIFIDVCLTKPVASGNIWVRLVKYIPFVPRDGDRLRLQPETEGEEPLDMTLCNVVYDMDSGTFIEQQEDDRMVESYSEEGLLNETEAVEHYKKYGFTRLNFPQGEAR